MKLKKIAAQAGIAGALSLAGLGLGAGLAHADPPPPWPVPGVPGYPGYRDAGFSPYDRDDHYWGAFPADRDDWHGQWVNAPWGDGPAPWGWGAPPPPAFNGPIPPPWGPPPPAFNYWGQNVQPVFDPGFNHWGFWLFGVWVPL